MTIVEFLFVCRPLEVGEDTAFPRRRFSFSEQERGIFYVKRGKRLKGHKLGFERVF